MLRKLLRRSLYRCLVRPLALLPALVVAMPAGAAQPVKFDPAVSPHYLTYDGVIVPLIGMSSEFIPHVNRTHQPEDSQWCTYPTYPSCIDRLVSRGLNKMQIWLAIDSSVGIMDHNIQSTYCYPGGAPPTTNFAPYCFEQPFFWNGGRWNLDRPEGGFYDRINQILKYAAEPPFPGAPPRNVIVELNLFARSGTASTSPWASSRNIGGISFTNPKYFTRYETATSDSTANQPARQRQIAFVREAVTRLNANPNFYWQVANEPDQSPQSTTNVGINATVNWHLDMAKLIFDTEATLPVKHPIAVNFWSATAFQAFMNHPLKSYVSILNGHYVTLIPIPPNPATGSQGTPNTPLYGAIPMIRTYYSSGSTPPPGTFPQMVFGFNETKSTTNPALVSARAEAWEFMLGHGGTYDNYNLDRSGSKSDLVLDYLGFLKQFLTSPNVAGRTLDLAKLSRITGNTSPGWASNLPNYPNPINSAGGPINPAGGDGAGLGNTYWSSMQWLRQQYVLYIHHSSIPDANLTDPDPSRFKRYAPCYKATGYTNTLGLALGSISGWYVAEWFVPDRANISTPITPRCVNNINWPGSGRQNFTSPRYPYDLALRVMRCPNGVGPCAQEVACTCTTRPVLCPRCRRRRKGRRPTAAQVARCRKTPSC